MDILNFVWDLTVNVDESFIALVQNYGEWIYAIIFLIIFLETGLVVTPFLPGDSLLFIIGTVAATGAINLSEVSCLVVFAAIIGDAFNYGIGRFFGPRIFSSTKSGFLNQKYLERTKKFFAKYGGKTIVIARFIPIIRTYAPFIAGMGKMDYRRFSVFNVVGAVAWVAIFCYGGYFLGNLPVVKNNISSIVLLIIVLSVMPALIEGLRVRLKKPK